MSIATKTGDRGSTGLAGGLRISKADLRVESYGTVDDLGAFLAFARSVCPHPDIAGRTEEIQRDLFRLGGALATPPEARRAAPGMLPADVDRLSAWVNEVEATEGLLSDWALPGSNTAAAAYEMARTVCRRAERATVRLNESGDGHEELVLPEIVAYLNRLSDLLWLFGRLIELRAGDDAKLRTSDRGGPGFSKAW